MDLKAEKLLNGKNLVFLATTMADGSPQVTPVWGDYEDSYIRINTAEGRLTVSYTHLTLPTKRIV